jgi:hypothetical protein
MVDVELGEGEREDSMRSDLLLIPPSPLECSVASGGMLGGETTDCCTGGVAGGPGLLPGWTVLGGDAPKKRQHATFIHVPHHFPPSGLPLLVGPGILLELFTRKPDTHDECKRLHFLRRELGPHVLGLQDGDNPEALLQC